MTRGGGYPRRVARSGRRSAAWIVLAVACQAPEDPPLVEIEGTMVNLVTAQRWQPLAAEDDPFADHRPAEVMCVLGLGWLYEATALEVNTGTCTYGAFGQPTLVDIVPGAALSLSVYHFDLLAPEPATAHAAVMIGDHVIFEREVAIPGKAEVFTIDLVAEFAAPAGTPVVFHLHNHGQNAWTFASLQAEVESP